MSRALAFGLDQLEQGNHARSRAFRISIYDVRSTTDTVGDIVAGNPLLTLTGPRDFTDECLQVQVQERAGDYLTSGVQGSEISFILEDPNNLFNPMNLLLDSTGDGRWLRAGNVVRILVGDSSIDEADWEIVFTGVLVGSPGITNNRDSVFRRISMRAVDRSNEFVDLQVTSTDFPLSTTYLSVATDLAEISMGLDTAEIDFAGFGSNITGHTSTQFVEESPLTSLANVMIVDGFLPRFDGEGKLTQTQATTSGFPARFYSNEDLFIAIDFPQAEIDIVDSVCIIGLDADLTKVKQPIQDLVEVQLTTGWFAQDEDFGVFWSEDHTVVAEDIKVNVLRSVNGAVNFGGGESFTLIPAPFLGTGTEGFVGSSVKVSTGFAPFILIFMTINYIAAAWIPDIVIAFGGGTTIPIGRFAQALILIGILLIMSQIGRLHVRFRGSVIEYAFLEVKAIAELDQLPGDQPNRVTVQNHMVQTQAIADTVAREQLFLQVARGLPRTIQMMHDLKLEPHDIFEVTDDVYGARRFLIETIAYTLQRGAAPLANITASEITAGLSP